MVPPTGCDRTKLFQGMVISSEVSMGVKAWSCIDLHQEWPQCPKQQQGDKPVQKHNCLYTPVKFTFC